MHILKTYCVPVLKALYRFLGNTVAAQVADRAEELTQMRRQPLELRNEFALVDLNTGLRRAALNAQAL